MAAPTGRLRRAAALLALGAGVAASIATSPAGPPQNELISRAEGVVALTAERPSAVIPLRVDVTDEALWPRDPEVRVAHASVYFATGRSVHSSLSQGDAAVRLTLVREGESRGSPSGELLSSENVDLVEECPPDRDCHLEYRLVLQWLYPVPSGTLNARWAATGTIVISGPEQAPFDAAVTVRQTGGIENEPIPVLGDAVQMQRVEMDAEHPVAAWHVIVEATPGALTARPEFPLEGVAAFTATISGQSVTDFDREPPVMVSIVPDDGSTPRGASLTAQPLPAAIQFPGFEGCAPNELCRRGYTVIFEWQSVHPGAAAPIDWHFHAGLTYHHGLHPTPEGAVTVSVTETLSVGPESPGLRAAHSGQFAVDTSDDGPSGARIVFRLNDEALPSGALAADRPIGLALVTLEASGDNDVQRVPVDVFVVTSAASETDPPVSRSVAVGAAPESLRAYPFRACLPNVPCEEDIVLTAHVQRSELDRVEGESITLHWRVEAWIPYVRVDRVPEGAALEISDEPIQ